jgi:hypothetical protein
MSYEPWHKQPPDEHELQKDKDHYYRVQKEHRLDEEAGESVGGSNEEYAAGSGSPWWLTAIGVGLLAVGAGLPTVRWLGVWNPPSCAIGGVGGAQQTLGTIIVWLSVLIVVFGVLCLLGLAARRFVSLASLAHRETPDHIRAGNGSLAYACFLAVSAGLGVTQIMVIAGSLQCAGALGTAGLG